jgi:hypothetical protein
MPPTLDRELEEQATRISNRALNLLDCFTSGVDDIIFRVAEEIARRRQPEGRLSIDIEDIEKAGDIVLGRLKESVDAGGLPKHLGQAIEDMHHCLRERCLAARTLNPK